jgi:hypothetical protein
MNSHRGLLNEEGRSDLTSFLISILLEFGGSFLAGSHPDQSLFIIFFSILHISPLTNYYLHQHSPSRWAKDI